MDFLRTDLRQALRSLRQAPAFFSLVIGILALGIAFSVSVFTLADGILLRPLPYRNPQRLFALTSFATKPPFASNGSISYNEFVQFESKSRSFSDLAVTFRTGWSRVILGGPEPIAVQGAFVSPNLFATFGRSPMLGRTFTAEENLRAERVIVIGQALWAQRFASSPEALGQDLEMDHLRWRVIGVMPADFQVPFLDTQVWAPILSHPEWHSAEDPVSPDRPLWDVFARVKAGISLSAAQSEIDSIEHASRAPHPDFNYDTIRIVPLREHFTGPVRKPMLILLAAVGFLFLIACANVANLVLARAAARQRELSIRTALGAGQIRLLRLLLTEAIVFSLIAGALAVFAAALFVPALKTFSPPDIPLLSTVALDTRSLLFAAALSVSVSVLLGIAPAMRKRQGLGESLNAPSRSATESRKSRRAKAFLVSAEFALAMVLLTACSLLIRSFVAVLNVNPGFHPEHVLTIQFGLSENASPSQVTRFYRDAMERIAALPGVQAVGGISNLFFLDETRTHALRQVEGQPPEPKASWKPLVWARITGDYFEAMGIPLVRGRFFNENDRPNSPLVVIVNETLARRYWPNQDPIGKRLKGFDPRGQHDDWLTVVGVVKDTRSGGIERAPFSQIYEVQSQRGEQIGNFVIRSSSQPAQLASEVRTLIRRLNPGVLIPSISTMERLVSSQTMQRRFQTWLIGVFSALALGLAALGVFAVMHYSVAAKANEIGIRMAVGADPRDIVRLVLASGSRLAVIGIAAGALASVWSNEAVASMLYHVQPADLLSFSLAATILLAIALLAAYFPARRASHIDPVVALRQN